MKKILVTVVLGFAVVAGAQDAARPAAQGQPAASSQAPVIKDPAEYNAYVGAVGQADPKAKISGLEAFLIQYPNSVMKNTALEVLMGAYQQTNNMQKTVDTAQKLVAADSCNVRALALLAYFDRIRAQGGDPNAAQLLGDASKYGQQGLDCLPKVTDQDILKNKDQMMGIFKSAIGINALQIKDYSKAIENLKPVVDANPQDFSVVYPLALAYLTPVDPKTPLNPANNVNGIWYAARAAAIAPPQAEPQIEKYARSQYIKFHGGDDGWAEVLAAAKANGAQPTIKPAPTPAEQVHNMLTGKKPEDMSFAEWQFVLTNGSSDDQAAVWNAIKGKPIAMNGTVISTMPDEFMIAGSSDDIDAKKADITLKFEEKVPPRLIPKDGASFDFQGEPDSYTQNPFMMVMLKGQLVKPKTAPAPTHHSTTHKPAASN
jgi:tetratricopeptide (TPR) repeat protein